MKKFLVLLFVTSQITGCVIYNIEVNKCIHIEGSENAPIIQGAELEGNEISPRNDIKPKLDAEIPLTK